MNGLVAWAPRWALDAGLPPPETGETLGDYCVRLGVPYSRVVEGLTPRTATNAHIRFSSLLAEHCPEAWDRHLQQWVKAKRRP